MTKTVFPRNIFNLILIGNSYLIGKLDIANIRQIVANVWQIVGNWSAFDIENIRQIVTNRQIVANIWQIVGNCSALGIANTNIVKYPEIAS